MVAASADLAKPIGLLVCAILADRVLGGSVVVYQPQEAFVHQSSNLLRLGDHLCSGSASLFLTDLRSTTADSGLEHFPLETQATHVASSLSPTAVPEVAGLATMV